MAAESPSHDLRHNPELWAQCMAFQQASELIGRRWTGVILYMLLQGRSRFSELLNNVHGISDRLLTERLRELEEKGLVERFVIPESPVRVEYALTEAGRDAEAIISVIWDWGNKWLRSEAETEETQTR